MTRFRPHRRSRPLPYRIRNRVPQTQAVVFDPSLRRARELMAESVTPAV